MSPDYTAPSSPAIPSDLEPALSKYGLTIYDLLGIKDLFVTIAHTGGGMMRAADPCVNSTDQKNNSSDLVTETDKAVEAMVQCRLATTYPNILFFGEETHGGQKLTDEPTFVCDPIDGTINFVHGFPNYAISLALVINKKPVVGVVMKPAYGDYYSAVKGQGAFYTNPMGKSLRLPLRAPAPLSLHKALFSVEWGNQRSGPNWALRTDIFVKLLTSQSEGGAMCRSDRSSGSAALDFCYVAAGQLDFFFEAGVYAWDVAAGWCILEEAGGIVASANPGDWDPMLEGRLYFAVRGAKKEDQRKTVEDLWAMMGERRFVY
ncbi:hypothetical protein BDV96DRAFT_508119 [Lophiotrema nucula]|uniref:Inositol-1-monophosphatase n=1 Tax=Lophiotrema nucula TaxID=690887 RepID=A0A6A5YJB6_9PLEO|nr:hypothetical protein BDV96DRAFT_508119 [Lophiotrema nucula]